MFLIVLKVVLIFRIVFFVSVFNFVIIVVNVVFSVMKIM